MSRLAGGRVLVIDDHADLVANLVEILEGEGANVQHASDAAGALHLANSPFDVALVDVMLPDATGLSLLPRLKQAPDGAQEVLLITGHASLEGAIDALKGGAYAYLLKPFDPEELCLGVERALRQVRLSREAERLRSALERSEAELRTLVDTVNAMLFVLDEEGRILEANRAVRETTNLGKAELIGRSWVKTCLPEDEREAAWASFVQILETGSASAITRWLSVGPEGEGSERWVSWRGSLHRDEQSGVRVYASGVDVTEVRELEQRTRIVEKLAAVGTLSAGLAHEIRNPLNAASLQLRLLERRSAAKGAATLEEPIRLVKEELERLSRLVEDFLRFARPQELQTGECDLAELVATVLDLERPVAKQRGVRLELIRPDGQVPIEADPERLRQVVFNIVRNGIEATAEGGTVSVKVSQGRNESGFVVRDDGPGVPEADLPRIFEPFFTTRAEGTGLGLSIVHSLVTLHGGRLDVSTGDGTAVEVVLPNKLSAKKRE